MEDTNRMRMWYDREKGSLWGGKMGARKEKRKEERKEIRRKGTWWIPSASVCIMRG
jgi:hypothetical protein